MGSHADPSTPDLVGQVLDDRYRIEAVLGQGGMGMVFKAVQTSMQRPVAVKTLHPQLAMAPEFFERFKREAEIASRLHHPNIITIYDFGRTAQGVCYFVMEYLEGESLRQRVRRQGPLTLRDTAAVIEQVAVGVGHAHKQNVVHRDLKPHNIMLAKVDGSEYVKVLDFGLVKALEQEDDEQLTSTGQVLGTPQYMPPEQAGGETVDRRSDVYSLTGVLYFCLTGHSPFGANTVRKALQAALTQEVPPVATHRQGAPVPEAIDRVVRKGLKAEKADRFQSMEELVQAVQAAVAGVPDAALDAAPHFSPDPSKGEGSGSTGSSRRRGESKPRAASKAVSAVRRPLPKAVVPDAPAAPRRTLLVLAVVAGLAVAVGGAVGVKVLGGRAAAGPEAKPPPPPPTPVVTPTVEPAPVAAETFTVTVTTAPPGAEVLEDGAVVGTTPWEAAWTRGARRSLVFKLAGHRELERSLKLDTPTTLSFTLEPAAHAPTRPRPPKKKPDDGIDTFE